MEELERKERDRREKKLYKQLEKQQKKLTAKGIHVDMETLRQDYETQRAGGKSTLNLEAALAAAAAHAAMEEIDVVGGVEESSDVEDGDMDQQTMLKRQIEEKSKKMISPFSIESLLAKKQLSVAAQHAAQVAASIKAEKEEAAADEENNNPVTSTSASSLPAVGGGGGGGSPVPTSCSSPLSGQSSPPPNTRYLSSPSPSPSLHVPIPVMAGSNTNGFPNLSGLPTPASVAATIGEQLSLLKPLTACPEKQSPLFPASAAALLNRLEPRLSFSPPKLSNNQPIQLPQTPVGENPNAKNQETSP